MSKIGQQNAGMCSKIHGCCNPVFYKEPLSVPTAEEGESVGGNGVFHEDAEPNGEEEGEGHHADEGEPADVEEELDDIGEVAAVTDDSVIDEPAIASLIGVKRVHSLSESEEDDDDESYESGSDSMFSDSDPTFHA